MAWQTPKTDWTSADGVFDVDMNRIEGNIDYIENTTRTPNQTATPAASGPLASILNFFAAMIKKITGATNWYDTPATTLSAAKSHMNNTSNPHGVTAAQVGAVNKAGDTMTGALSIAPAGNASIELGRQDGTSSTPYIDFHSGATVVDYDARIIASGGTGATAGGTLNIIAAALQNNGHKVWHAGNDGAGSGLSADDTDGIHLRISNGVLEWSNDGGTTWEVVDTNWAGKTPKLFDAPFTLGAKYWATILSVTGAGFLTGIHFLTDSVYFKLRVTIDGVVLDDNPGYVVDSQHAGALTFLHRFNSSLLIEVYNTDSYNYKSIDARVSYLLD